MKNNTQHIEENPFSMSTGDLMAATLFVFVLLLSAAMVKINMQKAQVNEIVNNYTDTKAKLVIGLKEEFGANLHDWEAEIDSTTLCIRFQKEDIMFANDQSTITPQFQTILQDFFPRYIAVIRQFQDNIEEIRIEGHTSSSGGYYHNMELSQKRTFNVLKFCESLCPESDLVWMRKYITANGLSYSHPIFDENGKEDPTRSRRVEFRIKTKADTQIESIIEKLHSNK